MISANRPVRMSASRKRRDASDTRNCGKNIGSIARRAGEWKQDLWMAGSSPERVPPLHTSMLVPEEGSLKLIARPLSTWMKVGLAFLLNCTIVFRSKTKIPKYTCQAGVCGRILAKMLIGDVNNTPPRKKNIVQNFDRKTRKISILKMNVFWIINSLIYLYGHLTF